MARLDLSGTNLTALCLSRLKNHHVNFGYQRHLVDRQKQTEYLTW